MFRKWTHLDVNPGPSACEADVIPLHHVPICFHGAVEHISILSQALDQLVFGPVWLGVALLLSLLCGCASFVRNVFFRPAMPRLGSRLEAWSLELRAQQIRREGTAKGEGWRSPAPEAPRDLIEQSGAFSK